MPTLLVKDQCIIKIPIRSNFLEFAVWPILAFLALPKRFNFNCVDLFGNLLQQNAYQILFCFSGLSKGLSYDCCC